MSIAEIEKDTLAMRAGAREQLADAIVGVDTARTRLAEAKRAVELADDKCIDFGNRIAALTERVAFAKNRPAAADDTIAAILRGDNLETQSAAERAQAELDALQVQLDAMRRARQAAKDEVERRKEAIGLGEMRVTRMTAGVLRSSGATERLLAGLIDLEREVIRRRLGLAVLLRHDGVPVALLSEVERLLDGHALPTRSATLDHWANNPTSQAWAAALKELQRDPDARLPVD